MLVLQYYAVLQSRTDLLLGRRSLAAVIVIVVDIFTAISRILARRSVTTTADTQSKDSNTFPDVSHLPLLPLVEVHHCSVKVRDQVLAEEVDGGNGLFGRRGHGTFHLGVDLVDVGQLLHVPGDQVRVGVQQKLPVRLPETFFSHLQRFRVDELVRTRCSLDEVFTQNGAFGLPLVVKGQLTERDMKKKTHHIRSTSQ